MNEACRNDYDPAKGEPAKMMTWEEAVVYVTQEPNSDEFIKAFFFDEPIEEACRRYAATGEWHEVRRLLGPGRGAALDLGAGRGIASFALAADGWATTALEPDPSNIVGAGAIRRMVRATGLAINVVESWGEELPFASGSFDLVFCRQVLHHARNLGELCQEVARVLKPRGKMLAVREHVISRPEHLGAFLSAHPMHHLFGGEHAYLLADYLAAIRNAGLSVVAVMNPLSSDINLHPLTRNMIKQRIAAKWHLPSAAMIPNFVLALRGALLGDPGRPYSFLAQKPG